MTVWTVEEETYLRENFKAEGNKELGGKLGKTTQEIALKLRSLDLKRSKEEIHHLRFGKSAGKVPSEKELKFVRENYRAMGNAQFAEKFGCTVGHVQSLLRAAGVKRTKEEVNQIRKELWLARRGKQKE